MMLIGVFIALYDVERGAARLSRIYLYWKAVWLFGKTGHFDYE